MSENVEEMKEVLSTLSTLLPKLIREIVASIFSEEVGREMGKAAGAFYKSLIESGIPEQTAIKMTENYISVFTNFGDLLKKVKIREKSEES